MLFEARNDALAYRKGNRKYTGHNQSIEVSDAICLIFNANMFDIKLLKCIIANFGLT